MTTLHCPEDIRELLAGDGSVDLALNEPGYGSRVRLKQAWWGDDDDELLIGQTLEAWVGAHDGWHVLHSVHMPSLGVELDAVLIGPAGVVIVQAAYAPEARVWAGGDAFIVEGRRLDTIVDARFAALRTQVALEQRLGMSVPVSALVVPIGAAHVDIPLLSNDVAVVEPDALTWWLGQLASPWPSESAARTFDMARRSSTWEAA